MKNRTQSKLDKFAKRRSQQSAENKYIPPNAGVPQLHSLFQRGDSKVADTAPFQRPDTKNGPVAVGIGFDDRHDRTFLGHTLLNFSDIVTERMKIDFGNGGAVLNILVGHYFVCFVLWRNATSRT